MSRVPSVLRQPESRCLVRYEKAETILRIALDMQGTAAGISLEDIERNYADTPLSRRTAERMRDAIGRVFPRSAHEGTSMPFRFVHAADIHIDSPVRSLALRDPQLGELIGNASRRALEAIVKVCLDEQVDALPIAGDLYDGEQTSMKTARLLAVQIGRLVQAGCVSACKIGPVAG